MNIFIAQLTGLVNNNNKANIFEKEAAENANMELIRKYKQGKLTTADVRHLNHIVICLMVLVAIFSILWSVSLHMLTGDFQDGIISAKIIFKDRDYGQMNEKSKEIIRQDLQKLGQLPYEVNETPQPLQTESQTKKPKFKLEHIYETKDNAPLLARLISQQQEAEQPQATTTTGAPAKVVPDVGADIKFLSSQSIDEHSTRWSHGVGAQFVYAFPLISEIVAIIWTAMCLIYQTGNRKTSVLPKPWRIVVPSIVIFTLMSLGSLAYTILTNGYLRRLCGHLRQALSNPLSVSCGDAIALLRPRIHEHSVSHDAYLDLFRCSYVISMTLWFLALLIMVLRYIFAIDFQLVDIENTFDRPPPIQPVYTEVLQSSPQHHQQQPSRPRSEDDFQSAKSTLSDVAMPLLELNSNQPSQPQQPRQMPSTTVA